MTAEVREAFRELFGEGLARKGLPLHPVRVEVVIDKAPTAVANALRRALYGETQGRCLTFDDESFSQKEVTDPFMQDYDYVRTRLRHVHLRPQVSESLVKSLRFALRRKNETDRVLTLYSGDLTLEKGGGPAPSAPLFNPTVELAFLQPGRSISISGIYIKEGFGSADSAFYNTCRATAIPLDLAELPRGDTHAFGGPAAEQSGYAQSSLVANPRRHRVAATICAAPAQDYETSARIILRDACTSVIQRLQFVVTVINGAKKDGEYVASAADKFLVTQEAEGWKGVLSVQKETMTVARLIERAVYETTPQVAFVGATCIDHEQSMELQVRHAGADPEELKKILLNAVNYAREAFTNIRKGITVAA